MQKGLNVWVCPLQDASLSQLSAGIPVPFPSNFSSGMLPLVAKIQTASGTKVRLKDTAKLF